MKSRYLVFAATAVFTVAGATSASAKTKTASLKVSTVKPAAKYITGKATPGAKVKVSRYAKTYATGKATKTGTFKLKAKLSIKGNWHYRATATKAGYKTKVIHFGVKATTTAEVAALQSQITALNDKLAKLGSATSTTNNTDLQSQITALNSKIASLESQLTQAKTTGSTSSNNTATKPSGSTSTEISTAEKNETEFYTKTKELSDQIKTVNKKLFADQALFTAAIRDISNLEQLIQRQQSFVDEAKAKLAEDPDNQSLQLNLANSQNNLKITEQELTEAQAAQEKVGNGIMDLKNEIDSLTAQRDDLNKQLDDLYASQNTAS